MKGENYKSKFPTLIMKILETGFYRLLELSILLDFQVSFFAKICQITVLSCLDSMILGKTFLLENLSRVPKALLFCLLKNSPKK